MKSRACSRGERSRKSGCCVCLLDTSGESACADTEILEAWKMLKDQMVKTCVPQAFHDSAEKRPQTHVVPKAVLGTTRKG